MASRVSSLRIAPFFAIAFLIASPLSSKSHAGKVVLVRLCVDEEERSPEPDWQARLARRLVAASKVISKYADVRFVVRDTGRWDSDDRTNDLRDSLTEFEKEMSADGVRLVIGFSSQYKIRVGRNHLGGTRGPLRRHILVRESADAMSEREQVEVLVHELGHFMCASHSADPNSAMRPVVGDRKAKSPDFQIGFDEPNARILRTVGQELRDRHVTEFGELSPRSLKIMRKSYQKLNRNLPADTASIGFLNAIQRRLGSMETRPLPLDPGKVLIPIELPAAPAKQPSP